MAEEEEKLNQKHTFIWVLFIFLLSTGCQVKSTQSTVIPLQAAVVQGSVEIQSAGKTAFEPLKEGQNIYPGDLLRSVDATSFAEIGDSRSFFVLGPLASVVIDQLSSTADLTTTGITLQGGSVLVAAEQNLGEGFFEVSLPGDSQAAIHGSAMMINMDTQSSSLSTSITCTQGTASYNSSGGSLQLSAGTSMTIDMNGTVTEPPTQTMDSKIAARDPAMATIMSDRYLKYFPEMWNATITPEPTNTPTRVKSSTPTAKATWTPYPTFMTSTPEVRVEGPTRRPSVTVEAGFSGLTPEEQVNQGSHTFSVACQVFVGNCVCDSAMENPVVEILIVFDETGVTLGSGEEQLRYSKVWPNLYRVESNGTTAEITFLADGWEFYVTRDGSPCQLQTFIRQ
jgi:hypothetical protein